jgi:CheY-like chemotaxis protein
MTRVLLLEDSEDVLYVLKIELEWQGYDVDALSSGAEALAVARRTPPDVIVSDLAMPEMDGIEFIQRVRGLPSLRLVPAIALTGSGMERDVQRALGFGFTTHMTKPIEPGELVEQIEKLTSGCLQRKAS